MLRNFPTTSCEVHPAGLSTTTRPSTIERGSDARDHLWDGERRAEAGGEAMPSAVMLLGDVAHIDRAQGPQAHAHAAVGLFLQHARDLGLARAPKDVDEA